MAETGSSQARGGACSWATNSCMHTHTHTHMHSRGVQCITAIAVSTPTDRGDTTGQGGYLSSNSAGQSVSQSKGMGMLSQSIEIDHKQACIAKPLAACLPVCLLCQRRLPIWHR